MYSYYQHKRHEEQQHKHQGSEESLLKQKLRRRKINQNLKANQDKRLNQWLSRNLSESLVTTLKKGVFNNSKSNQLRSGVEKSPVSWHRNYKPSAQRAQESQEYYKSILDTNPISSEAKKAMNKVPSSTFSYKKHKHESLIASVKSGSTYRLEPSSSQATKSSKAPLFKNYSKPGRAGAFWKDFNNYSPEPYLNGHLEVTDYVRKDKSKRNIVTGSKRTLWEGLVKNFESNDTYFSNLTFQNIFKTEPKVYRKSVDHILSNVKT